MKILAVDDDPIILELLAHFIAASGDHKLVTAGSGAEALNIIAQVGLRPFDCFLFDINMPEMTGIDLTRVVREISRHAHTPTLMLTAMSDKRHVDAAFTAGATDYLTKPFEMGDFTSRLGVVNQMVSARRPRTKKIFSAPASKRDSGGPLIPEHLQLHAPIAIHDVENVIEYLAMENYVAQLSRSALFGSTTFAFSIRQIDVFHSQMTSFEFYSLVSDVAEVISDTMIAHQFLMSYAGNGTFVCVTEGGWRPQAAQMMDAVNLALSQTDLFDNAGLRLQPRVSTGQTIRLIWQTGASAMGAIAQAHTSAEAAGLAHEAARNTLWTVENSA
ncbi:response regulator [Roseovarius arcticus]|uniref:response regulator n=1 Tax=Roseovarius arcticus TaxID=2547404 RepID=UPI0011102E0C|nr:response regulator [Roseovarius arcticus]